MEITVVNFWDNAIKSQCDSPIVFFSLFGDTGGHMCWDSTGSRTGKVLTYTEAVYEGDSSLGFPSDTSLQNCSIASTSLAMKAIFFFLFYWEIYN